MTTVLFFKLQDKAHHVQEVCSDLVGLLYFGSSMVSLGAGQLKALKAENSTAKS